MSDIKSKSLAESTLGSLLIGSSVSGLRFGVIQLLFEPELNIQGQPYINLASAWKIYDVRPNAFPEDESDIIDGTDEQEVYAAVSLRQKVVINVEVLVPWPHLILTLDDNTVLYLNGKNDHYEAWTAGLSGAPLGQEVLVIVCPGGDLAFMLPNHGL